MSFVAAALFQSNLPYLVTSLAVVVAQRQREDRRAIARANRYEHVIDAGLGWRHVRAARIDVPERDRES